MGVTVAPTITRACARCSAIIPRRKLSWDAYAERKYCNMLCFRQATSAGKADAEPKWCLSCHRPFVSRGGDEGPRRWNARKFCSKCRQRGTSAKRSGGNGYIKVRVSGDTYKLEHRAIAEQTLGRPLKVGEVVHHINGSRADNRNSNLLVCTDGYHKWLHHEMGRRYAQEHFTN
ncbi:hypothetical protein LCGC14_2914430 [marine sediment metagenome]|uniref:HNH nuclease domain-containing protein n=1 Tax=marine sediment metagenome TaxID=412755 RepID=A0A0F9AGW6_9ZZZZ